MGYPKRPRSHIAGEQAVRWFSDACPENWIVSPIQPDYGLDLRVELVRGEEVTGEEFFVQVKGRSKASAHFGDAPVVHVPSTTINYWLGKLPPVLLVLVDLSREGFWFEWFEYAYPQYPQPSETDDAVPLSLPEHTTACDFAVEVNRHISTCYERMRQASAQWLNKAELTNLVFHAASLGRCCATMVLTLQSDRIKDEKQLRDLYRWFYFEFGLHDEFLEGRWALLEEARKESHSRLLDLLRGKLAAYRHARALFFQREARQEAGDLWLVPVKYSAVADAVKDTFVFLLDLEETLWKVLLLPEQRSEA